MFSWRSCKYLLSPRLFMNRQHIPMTCITFYNHVGFRNWLATSVSLRFVVYIFIHALRSNSAWFLKISSDILSDVIWSTECNNPQRAGIELMRFNIVNILFEMPWLLASPGHQQPWHWLCRIDRSLSYRRKDFNYLSLVDVEQWHKM